MKLQLEEEKEKTPQGFANFHKVNLYPGEGIYQEYVCIHTKKEFRSFKRWDRILSEVAFGFLSASNFTIFFLLEFFQKKIS